MIGKSLTQLVRLAMVLQVLNVACTELYGLPDLITSLNTQMSSFELQTKKFHN